MTAVSALSIGCDNEQNEPLVDGTTGEETTGEPEGAFFTSEEVSTILAWLGPLPEAPPPSLGNAFADDAAAAAFGQALFFDAGLSSNGEVACVTCHDPETGFSDSRGNTSAGVGVTDRSSMSILNGAYGAAGEAATVWQFWDGRCDSQWAQALLPIESPVEMNGSRSALALHLYDTYRGTYEEIFGPMPELRDGGGAPLVEPGLLPGDGAWEELPAASQDAVNEVFANFGKAVEAYERKLESRDSRFDQFWQDLSDGAADSDALTDQEKEGLRVFIERGRCLGCHSGPNFTDGQFHNIAVPQIGENVRTVDLGREDGLAHAVSHEFNCAGPWSDNPDKQACSVSKAGTGETGAFKTPSLRDVSRTPPYMHTGSMQSLGEVVSHYDLGGAPSTSFNGTRDELMRPLGLDLVERQALVAFLGALDGEPLDPSLTSAP